MALYTSPEAHAANPPETWAAVKTGARSWALTDQAGGILQTTATRREAEALRSSGFYFDLWHKEARWYAGEPVQGWKPYAPVVTTAPEDETAERIRAGVRDENLSWSDVADQSARGWCPASPDGTEPHIVTDDATCDECGTDSPWPAEADVAALHLPTDAGATR